MSRPAREWRRNGPTPDGRLSCRRLCAGLALALVLGLPAACGPGGAGEWGSFDLDAAREALAEQESAFFQAMSEGDADRMAELFAEDAIVHVADRPPIRGRGAIRDFYGTLFGFLASSTATPDVTRLSADGQMAFGAGATSNEFRGPEGRIRYSGKYLLVWISTDEGWRVVAYAVSGDGGDPVVVEEGPGPDPGSRGPS